MKKSAKNNENYKDIKLKEKDYNNEKDLAFFIEQEKKANKMLEEVKNFRKSFYLSKFVDFGHILDILDYVNWVKIDTTSYYDNPEVNTFIPEIDKNTDLTYIAKLNSIQKSKFKDKFNHEFGTFNGDLLRIRYIDSIEYEEYRDIEYNAEQKLLKIIDERFKLIKKIKDNFHPSEFGKKDLNEAENKINESFRPSISSFILKYKKILKLNNQNTKYLLTDKNLAIKIPSLTECTIEISDDEEQVTIISNGSRSWEFWYQFPSYIGKRHNITEILVVIFDSETNEYVSHEYEYNHEIEDIRR